MPSSNIFAGKEHEVKPINYIIESHIELSDTLPRQKLLELIKQSRIRINSSGFLYPLIDRESRMLNNDILLLDKFEETPASDEVNQVALFASQKLIITQWLRHFRWGFIGPKIFDAELVNYQAIKFFIFSRKLVINLRLHNIELRLRLFNLQNCLLKTDSMLIGHQNFTAPDSDEIELKQFMTVGQLDFDKDQLAHFLMLLWDKFQSPTGNFPKFLEKDFSYIYDELFNLNKN